MVLMIRHPLARWDPWAHVQRAWSQSQVEEQTWPVRDKPQSTGEHSGEHWGGWAGVLQWVGCCRSVFLGPSWEGSKLKPWAGSPCSSQKGYPWSSAVYSPTPPSRAYQAVPGTWGDGRLTSGPSSSIKKFLLVSLGVSLRKGFFSYR